MSSQAEEIRKRGIEEIRRLIDVAAGRRKADLVIKKAEIVNVFTEEIYKADIAIADGKIAGVGSYEGIKEVDARNLYAVPGLIDAHTHVEMSMLTLSEFAKIIVPKGTTAIIADPHEIANVLGVEGIKYLIEEAKTIPIRFYCMVPSCVPSSSLETSGARISEKEIKELLTLDEVLGLAEVMSFPDVIAGKEDVLKKILAAEKKDGHAPLLSGKELNAYVAAGIETDHESISYNEALEKLRLGMKIMIREGSAARNLKDLVELAKTGNRNLMLVTDGDRNLNDLIEEGYLDHVFRRAVEEGVDPIKALQMCTINPASHYNLSLGAIAPSRYADIVLLENLERFRVKKIFFGGEEVQKVFEGIFKGKRFVYPEKAKRSVKANKIKPEDIKIDLEGERKRKRARVIGIVEGEIVTEEIIEEIDGIKPERDILKIIVLERHKGSGRIGKGFVKGFGLKAGAVASSISHDSHNLIAVGADDESICRAVNRVIELQGGIVVVSPKGNEELQLEIAGLMTEKSAEEVLEKVKRIHKLLRELGCKLKSPIISLSFLALPVIPELKITDFGLIDVKEGKVVSIFA
ncbi:MAG: adenine deaminase [Archaeoglobus sp.]|nr:adenine deaminase [Archaeoglobus sp.]